MKKVLILIGVVAVLMMIGTSAFAASKTLNETESGTLITAEGTNNTLAYTDLGGSPQATIESTRIIIAVLPVYGFQNITALGALPTPTVIGAAGAKTFTYPLTSEANAQDTYGVYASVTFGGNTNGTGWTVQVKNGATVLFTLTKATVTTSQCAVILNEDGLAVINYVVTPSGLVTDYTGSNPNGSYASVTLTLTTDSTPVGEYLGANMNYYGGTADATDTAITTIETPLMKMTRSPIVNAPRTYTGVKNDAVPGAVISYVIKATNEGAATASNVIILDKVPANTKAFHLNLGAGTLSNVTLETPAQAGLDTAASGWTIMYTTGEPAGFGYGQDGGWFAMPADHLITNETGIGTVEYVKFEKASVTTAAGVTTFTWGVTIR
jgi:uncharacterized repeat protein (TIGR01451 family)